MTRAYMDLGLFFMMVVDSSMIKRAYTTQMTYEVSDKEKVEAQRALEFFKHASKLLDLASTHLDIMKTPFKDNPEMDPKEIMKARAAIRRFRDKSVENFNVFKDSAFQCVRVMQNFSSDTQTVKLMKSFISSVDDLEVAINKFVDLFKDLEDKDFAANIVKAIEESQKQCDDIQEMIQERIVDHIQKNILAATWVDSVSDRMQVKMEPKTPLILDLFNRRQDQLNDAIKERGELGN